MRKAIVVILLLARTAVCLAAETDLPGESASPGKWHETITLEEPLGISWEPQMVRVPVVFAHPCDTRTLRLRDWAGRPIPFQMIQPEYRRKRLARCNIAFITGLAPLERAVFQLHYSDNEDEAAKPPDVPPPTGNGKLITRKSLQWSILSAGSLAVRFLGSSGSPSEPIPSIAAPPPIAALRGADGIWRGRGELRSPFLVRRWKAEILAEGPIFAAIRIRYEFTGGHHYEVVLSAAVGSDCISIAEDFDLGRRSCFMLRSPARPTVELHAPALRRTADVMMRLTPHTQAHTTLAGRPAVRYASFAAANNNDLFVLFSVKPGEWRNPVGSAVNIITLKNDLTIHFPLEKGTRTTGLFATTLEQGTSDSIFRVIARASDVPLQDVLDMHLTDGQLELIKNPPQDPFELAEIVDAVGKATQAIVAGGYNCSSCQQLDPARIGLAARVYRRLKDNGKADSPTAELLKARLTFLGNVFFDKSFYGRHILLVEDLPPGADYDLDSINWLRNVQRFTALAEIALAVPDYPLADQWLDHAEEQLALTLKHLVTPWGMWKQGDATHSRALQLLQRTSQALAASGRNDQTDNEAFKLMRRYQPMGK